MTEVLPPDACGNAATLSRMAIDAATEANMLWGTDDERAQAAIGVAEIAVGVWGECPYAKANCVLPDGEECPIAGLLDEMAEYGRPADDDSI